jgi:hypothetical protein
MAIALAGCARTTHVVSTGLGPLHHPLGLTPRRFESDPGHTIKTGLFDDFVCRLSEWWGPSGARSLCDGLHEHVNGTARRRSADDFSAVPTVRGADSAAV